MPNNNLQYNHITSETLKQTFQSMAGSNRKNGFIVLYPNGTVGFVSADDRTIELDDNGNNGRVWFTVLKQRAFILDFVFDSLVYHSNPVNVFIGLTPLETSFLVSKKSVADIHKHLMQGDYREMDSLVLVSDYYNS